MTKSKIDWCDRVWNPITGCTSASAGCDNCYAARMGHRLAANPKSVRFGKPFSTVMLHDERLTEPLKRKKPTVYFVNSMGDLFHDDVPDSYIAKVFAAMLKAYWHQFIILTKRPQRMNEVFSKGDFGLSGMVADHIGDMGFSWPVDNVWLGVSVEDQETANERIPLLLETPAAHRFISYEPAIGQVDLVPYIGHHALKCTCGFHRTELDTCPMGKHDICNNCGRPCKSLPTIDWVIMGGETGKNARPMHPDWASSVQMQCEEAGVPFFFKRYGLWKPAILEQYFVGSVMPDTGDTFAWVAEDGSTHAPSGNGLKNPFAMGKRHKKLDCDRLLNGKAYRQFPPELAAIMEQN